MIQITHKGQHLLRHKSQDIGYTNAGFPSIFSVKTGLDQALLGGSGAPINAKYILQVANPALANAQALGSLATGLLKNATTTGILTIAAQGVDYYAPAGTDVAVADGGTGASTPQAAIDALSQVSGATNEYVLTKDTVSGNAVFKIIPTQGAHSLSATLAIGNITGANDIVISNGRAIETGTTAGDTLLIRAYDTDTGPSYTTFITLTAGATPTCDLSGSVTIASNYIYRVSGTDVAVTDGGTGRGTALAYSVICGGTTDTGAHQSVASLGNAGELLTSAGASALPSWQPAPAGGCTLDNAYDFGGAGVGRAITADTGAVTITVPDTKNNTCLELTQNNTTNNPEAFVITTTATTSTNDMRITSSKTTGNILNITGSALTTGTLAYFYSDSADTGIRNLVSIINDNSLTENVTNLYIKNDGGAVNNISLEIDHNTVSSPAINIDVDSYTTSASALNISSTSTGLSSAQLFKTVYNRAATTLLAKTGYMNSMEASRTNSKTSGTLADDFDLLALIRTDVTSGAGGTSTPAGSVLLISRIATQSAGTLTDTVKGIEINMGVGAVGDALNITTSGLSGTAIYVSSGSTVGTIMSINGNTLTNGGIAYLYSDSADAGGIRDLVSIINDNSAATGATGLYIQQDANQKALNITAGNTTTNSETITASSLTTGNALYVYSNSADVSARNLTYIYNDNAAAVGAIPLTIANDAVISSHFYKGIKIGGVTVYFSDGTTPNGALSAIAGDVCYGADSGKMYYNTGTTVWTTGDTSGCTLDSAYDFGGAGAGRTITADTGAVAISGTAETLDIDSTATTQVVADITASSLTTGTALRVYSNSADVTARNLVSIIQANGSASGAIGLYIEMTKGAYAIDVNKTSNTKGVKIRSDNDGALFEIVSTIVGYTTDAANISFTGLTTGKGLNVTTTGSSLTSGELITSNYTKSSTVLSAKTGNMNSMSSSRTNTKTSATLADDFDLLNLTRTDITEGAGGTTTSAGSVLYIGRVATQTAGTLTDSVKGIEINMNASAIGTALDITTASVGKSFVITASANAANIAQIITGNSLTTGTALSITHSARTGSSFTLLSTDSTTIGTGDLTAKTGQVNSFTATRNNSSETTTNDDFDIVLIGRTNQTNTGTTPVINAAGSILRIIGTDTQTTGTLTPTYKGIELTMSALNTGDAINIDQNNTGAASALVIDSEAATATTGIVNMDLVITTGIGIDISEATLTTGSLLNLVSNSADASTRNLVKITNDNSAATGAATLKIQQDADNYCIDIDSNGTGTAGVLHIDSTTATATAGIIDMDLVITTGIGIFISEGTLTTGKQLELYDNSAVITSGELLHAEHAVVGATIAAKTGYLSAISSSREYQNNGGTLSDDFEVLSLSRTSRVNHANATYNSTGSVLNIYNLSTVTAGATSNTVRGIEISMAGATSLGEGLYIGSALGKAASIVSGVTTDVALSVVVDSVTSGNAIYVSSSSADTSARGLVNIKNANVASVGTVPIIVLNDAVVSTNFKIAMQLNGVTVWTSNGTTPNGNLSGTAGDVCVGADGGKSYSCTVTGTTWVAF